MRDEDYFRGKNISVVGLGRSGLASASLLYDLGAKVSVTDKDNNESTQANASRLKEKHIDIELGRHTQGFIKGRDLVILSPGVDNNAMPVVWAEELGIPVISEIELAWRLCPASVIAVTGTNGKTTVATLIGRVIEAWGRRCFICGNIGNTFSGEVSSVKEGDFVSLEVSSFQLERIDRFKPKISVILNFSRNHLDRYKSLEEYLTAKKRIFMNQDKSDYLILNYDDSALRHLAREAKASVVYFSQEKGLNPNQSAVLAVASVLGIDREVAFGVFKEFKGVEHRLEYVAEIDNVKFINDSKATTVDATVWALNNLPYPVILIAGGREKGNDYGIILDLAKKKVREAVLIGESKERIRRAFEKFLPLEYASDMEEAVAKAFRKARGGDNILLSPMCKSFDMFSDYEERGRIFKESVKRLAEGLKDRKAAIQSKVD